MIRFHRILAAAFAVALLVSPVGCSKAADAVIIVNGEAITRAVYDRSVEIIKLEDPNAFATEESAAASNKMIVDGLVDSTLMRQEAARIGAEIGQQEIEGRLEMFKMGFGDEAAFNTQLADAGLTLDDLDRLIRDALAQEAVMKAISEEATKADEFSADDVQAFYDENQSLFGGGATAHLQHILFDVGDKATAERVLAEVKADADFGEAAKQYSKDEASAVNGGDLGVAPTAKYVPEFTAAADALAVGEISGLVETQFGWHIIKKLAEEPATVPPLAEVEDQVRQTLAQTAGNEAFDALLLELRAAATIEFKDESLRPAGY